MTDNSKLVLNFLKQNFGKEFTKQEIMAELKPNQVEKLKIPIDFK